MRILKITGNKQMGKKEILITWMCGEDVADRHQKEIGGREKQYALAQQKRAMKIRGGVSGFRQRCSIDVESTLDQKEDVCCAKGKRVTSNSSEKRYRSEKQREE